MRAPGRIGMATAAIFLAAAGVVRAQGTTATLKGVVSDRDGEPLPGIPVQVSSATHGAAARTHITDMEGRFRFQLLPPAGDYELTVKFPGFAETRVGPVDLDPGKTTIQNITLSAADELTEHVEVVAHGSIVDTENTKTSTTFNQQYIEGLPIIGRSYLDILTLTPGVTDTDGDGNPNVQGARETGLQYRLDGGNITDPVTGTFGQFLNLEAIEEIEVITAGASAEYGRADGGFANIITKSGGNDFEGSFKLFWRDRILDGDGAGENSDAFLGRVDRGENRSRRLDAYLTLGGALVKDRLWYFATYQDVDRIDVANLAGVALPRTTRGRTTFAKLTWQGDADNKVALQFSDDPYRYEGFYLDLGVDADSDAIFYAAGRTPQLRWTSIISPVLLMETLLTHYDSGVAITPVSPLFHEVEIGVRRGQTGASESLVAGYPAAECSHDHDLASFIPNCDPTRGKIWIYQIDQERNITSGPFPFRNHDERIRNSIKTDMTLTLEEAWGEHQVKAGLEFADEKYADRPIINPIMTSQLSPCRFCRDTRGMVPADAVEGFQLLEVPIPTSLERRAAGFNSSAYVTDTWKVRPNLTVQAGLRFDQEDMDTVGMVFFEPRDEKRRSITVVEGLCADARRVRRGGGLSNSGLVCDSSQRVTGQPPVGSNLIYAMDEETPEWLRKLDRDQDGIFDSGDDGPAWLDSYTRYTERVPENLGITNRNLSPRLSISWDPWADGRTKVFGTWGRYFDRLYLSTIVGENSPDFVNFIFTPDPQTFVMEPDSVSQSVTTFSVEQVDRGLRTPFTDVFSLGIERELATEWAVNLIYTQRLAWDLLQDTDMNHILCPGYEDEFGIDPARICPGLPDASGRPTLNDDLFGSPLHRGPNSAPDLYNVNPNFNRVMRVGNFNSSRYRSLAAELRRRLHRNWQMSVSYTYSRAQGNAESFLSSLGNDPSTLDDEYGFLSYDQRHRAILLMVAHLPKDVQIGTTVRWEGGTPFSVVASVVDVDNVGNSGSRTFYPTGRRNDQRNGNYWNLDFKVVRSFIIGKVHTSADLTVNNIFGWDDATIGGYRITGGGQLQSGPRGLRRFGRFWELGLSFNF